MKSPDIKFSNSANNLSANLTSLSGNQQFPPQSGFTYSFWCRLPSSDDSSYSTQTKTKIKSIFDVFYLYVFSISDDANNFLTFRFDCKANKFSLYSSQCGKNQHQYFRSSTFSRDEWHHVAFTYFPPKRLLSKKAMINLYIDGLLIDELQTPHVNFTSNLSSEGYIGSPIPQFVNETSLMNSRCPIWHLGPTNLFATVLPNPSIAFIYLQGPSHTSPFWGESPLLMSKHSLRTSILTRLHKISDVIAPELAKRKIESLNFNKQLVVPPDDLIFSYNAHNKILETTSTNNNVSKYVGRARRSERGRSNTRRGKPLGIFELVSR